MQKAEAEHKVATEQCDAMTGAQRDECKEKADAELEAAKTRAQEERDAVQR